VCSGQVAKIKYKLAARKIANSNVKTTSV
jgi:hypothetical protein